MPQAFTSYHEISSLTDSDDTLNLACTHDERKLLSVDLDRVLAEELEREVSENLDYLGRYLVKDPYGEELLLPSIAGYFSRTDRGWSVTCGAGVTSLLGLLARLAADGPAYGIGETYPDFPFWLERSGCRPVPCDASLAVEEIVRIARTARPSVLFLERPGLFEGGYADLGRLARLCDGVAPLGTIVLVDESNANYHPPSFSAFTLVPERANLGVLRGFSKAYSLGGLRLAYALSSNRLAERLRTVVPPLLASSLSLRLGRRLLALGDVARPLRERIVTGKEELAEMLRRAGLRGISASSRYLPYVLLDDDPEVIRSRIEARGIRGKRHGIWPGDGPELRFLYRLSAPLTAERMAALRTRMGAPMGDGQLPPAT